MANSPSAPNGRLLVVKSINKIIQERWEDMIQADRVTLIDQNGDFVDLTNIGSGTSQATTPTILNIPVLLANTEQVLILPSNLKQIMIKVRGNKSILKYSFTNSNSGTNYITINRGTTYQEDGLNLSSKVLYFQTPKPNQLIELLIWT